MLNKEQNEILNKCEINKESLREEALKNDYLRLKSKFEKITKILYFQRISLILLTLLTLTGCIFLYMNIKPEKFTYDKTLVLTPPIPTITSSSIPTENQKDEIIKDSIFIIQFENQNSFTHLALKTEQEAQKALSQLKKMKLPKARIIKDIKEETNYNSIENNKYYLQLGAYNRDFLSSFTNNFVDLHFIEEKGYYKYALGPFSRFSRAKQLAKNMNLKDYYICKYQNN